MKNTLFIIPARGGSKRLPKKNIKSFFGLPLIAYSLNFARQFVNDDQICVSTDDEDIINILKEQNYTCQFQRPSELSSDSAKSDDVIRHAINFYATKFNVETVILLQPTTPFRKESDLKNALTIFQQNECEMVVSAKKVKASPYTHLFEIQENGYLQKSKKAIDSIPDVYEVNGSIYIIDAKSIVTKDMYQFSKIKLIEMDENYSVDIDTQDDWDYAVYLVNSKKVIL